MTFTHVGFLFCEHGKLIIEYEFAWIKKHFLLLMEAVMVVAAAALETNTEKNAKNRIKIN